MTSTWRWTCRSTWRTPAPGNGTSLMTTFQETVPGAPAGTTWVEMKEVYALEA